MRITAGQFKNKQLVTHGRNVQKGAIRPTTAKMREAIFNILKHSSYISPLLFEELNILDVCCGTGAFGLEGLSRGAHQAYFIDINRAHIALVKENIRSLSVEDRSNTMCIDATKLPTAPGIFQIIYIDPPYSYREILKILNSLENSGWLGQESIVIIEMRANHKLQLSEKFIILDTREYGITKLVFLKLNQV